MLKIKHCSSRCQGVWVILHIFIRGCNFHVILPIFLCLGITFFQIFKHHNNRSHVPCDSRRNFPRTSPQCCYIFLVLRDNWFQHLSVKNRVSLKPVLVGCKGCCPFLISLLYRLNQTEYAVHVICYVIAADITDSMFI